MRQIEKKKRKDKTAAMIMLCFCLIALTSIFTLKASMDKIARSAENMPVVQETPTAPLEQEDAETFDESKTAKDKAESAAEEDAETFDAAAEPASKVTTVDSQDDDGAGQTYLCPMDMEIAVVSKAYSMDMVIYNPTLDQYMTHPGIDLEGPMNSGVKAIADGTVTDMYEDDAYGITIEITHENGMISKYANLESSALVEKGDVVSKGKHIANIGQSALYESMEKCHLHFELYQKGKLVDPAVFIDFS